jgi:hypothetical protein
MFNCISTGKVAYACRDDINEEGANTGNSTSCFAGVENCNNIYEFISVWVIIFLKML